MRLDELMQAGMDRRPEKDALALQGERITYGRIHRMANALAATLQARGVRRGDRVALYLGNRTELVVGLLATLRLGAVTMPLSPQVKADKLRYLLADARPTCLVTCTALAGTWQPLLASADSLHTVVVAGSAGRDDPRVITFAAAVAADPARLGEAGAIDLDLAAIIYTSGSTGVPKGVMLTHASMVSAARSIITYLGLRQDDVILCALPLSFDYGLYQILMGFAVGATVVLEPSFAFPAQVLRTMERERVTVFPGVPTMFALLDDLDLGRFDLSALRTITNTAAALSERQIRDLRARYPQARLFSMYGLTECKRVSYLPPEELDRRPASVGRGMPNEEVYLVDETGARLPPGSTGELVIRGSNVMRGYWGQPEETARRLRPGLYPGEVVLYSGDIFRTDAQGFLYFVARKDDVIKSRGEKVSPREVENAIHALPGVKDVAVIGVPDPLLGEAVKAFVVLRPGAEVTKKDVLRHCTATLEGFMVPREIELVARLPTTSTGKVSRAALREHEGRGTERTEGT